MTQTIRNLMTVKQFSQIYPAFSEGCLRTLIFHSKTNGFDPSIIRIGRKVLIDEARFFECVDKQQNKA